MGMRTSPVSLENISMKEMNLMEGMTDAKDGLY